MLLERLWTFLNRPAPLDPVQLHYWCRVAGALLLRAPDAASSLLSQRAVTALLPRLMRHVYADSVCVLLKCLLGLPIAAPLPGADADAHPAPPPPKLSLKAAISGDHALLEPCVSALLGGGDGASNAADLLCTICAALPDRPDALELRAAFVPAFVPLLSQIYDAALAPDPSAGLPSVASEARLGALRVAAAALKLEQRCVALSAESLSWLPAELLSPEATHATAKRKVVGASCAAPFARLLTPHLDAFNTRLLHSKSLQQLHTAEVQHHSSRAPPSHLPTRAAAATPTKAMPPPRCPPPRCWRQCRSTAHARMPPNACRPKPSAPPPPTAV
jgi:hypothetical protein